MLQSVLVENRFQDFEVLDSRKRREREVARRLVEDDLLERVGRRNLRESSNAQLGVLRFSHDFGERLVVGQRIERQGAKLSEMGPLRDGEPVGRVGQERERTPGFVEIPLVAGDVDQTLTRPLSGEGPKGVVPVGVGDRQEDPGGVEFLQGDAADARIGILLGDRRKEVDLALGKVAHGLGADLGVGALPLRTQAIEQAHEVTISLVASKCGNNGNTDITR